MEFAPRVPVTASRERLEQALAADPAAVAPIPTREYQVHLPNFDGPLDLLLHLIRRDQINVYDIPIAHICKSYLDYINRLADPDVGVAGEFMVMASTLLLIKSAMLMPQDPEVEAEDPRMPLVQQLLEYERIKKAAEALDRREWLGREVYARPTGTFAELMPKESLLDAPIESFDAYQLLVALKQATTRTTRPPIKIETDPVSIRTKVIEMAGHLDQSETIPLTVLLPMPCTVQDVIVAFFATLEMARLKFVEIVQHEIFGPIYLRAVRPMRELNVELLEQF
jgi:segregation and condensation protein A